ncbi:hypothetical protein EV190_11329 [Actinorugispora endophytica]|uniref:Uncharacterized protein n=1 Tax=Actinorugispora endophytica TaxID=1605990 RepID=A0A4R6USQ3_9ACTN|nr:hypothetical protein EV190_11329 [Actinorugispora endophytica]
MGAAATVRAPAGTDPTPATESDLGHMEPVVSEAGGERVHHGVHGIGRRDAPPEPAAREPRRTAARRTAL